MYCLIDFCCICFYNKEYLQPLSDTDSENITYFIKLTSFVSEMSFNEMNDHWLVCSKCCEIINIAYKFRQRCLRSKTMLIDYISQLHQASNINGATNIYLTDINKFGNIKKEYHKEINLEKTEMFLKVNEEDTEETNFDIHPITNIKRENPFSSKIDTNHIEFENVVLEIERGDQFLEENIEKSFVDPLENQDNIKIGVSQNDILTVSAIKKEKQDFTEYSHKRFGNTLKTCDGENYNTEIKENYDYSLNSVKYSDNPVTNLDEIKIDIVENDIEEFSTEDNVIPFKYQEDKTAKEINFIHKSLEKEKCSVLTPKVKTIKKYECNICKKFLKASFLITHMKNHTRKKPYECDLCQKKFRHSSNLKEHIKIHSGEKPHKCEVCQKKFANIGTLREHKKIHTGEKPYECEVCQKKFRHSSNLKAHMKIHTGEKPHDCDVCQKKFTHVGTMREHMKIHTGEKPHACDICQKKFARSSTLKEHIKIHTGEKPNECDLCQKKFAYISNLREHMNIHTGEKPHECSVCQKKFNQSSNLKKHMKIHTAEKSHECDVCQKKFIQLSTLTRHKIIHTKEKPYECCVCQKKFTQSSSLKKHTQTAHEMPHK